MKHLKDMTDDELTDFIITGLSEYDRAIALNILVKRIEQKAELNRIKQRQAVALGQGRNDSRL